MWNTKRGEYKGMIFFLINKTKKEREDGYFEITDIYAIDGSDQDCGNVMLAPWNEIKYAGEKLDTVEKLKQAVIEAAKKDEVCREINLRALEEYGLYLYLPDGISEEDAETIEGMDAFIMRILTEWAHPMIGNIMNSPQIRPQTMNHQYEKWTSAPENLMDAASREKTQELFRIAGPLLRSGHDQVRICWDMRTLARAFIGEISTLATRRLEKIFALDLCRSEFLLISQRTMLARMLENINHRKDGLLLEQFRIKGGFRADEYIPYYFAGCVKQEIKQQTIFYIALIEDAVGVWETLPGLKHPAEYADVLNIRIFKEWRRQWNLLPPVIRCVVIQNSIRRFLIGRDEFSKFSLAFEWNRFSMKGSIQPDGRKTDVSFCEASAKVLTVLEDDRKLKMAWSWNRDENAASTQFYRKCLLPLWAGPSGHAHGHLDLVLSVLDSKAIKVTFEGEKSVDAAAITLAGLFAFWRLYYDKRITGVHTIAETFEASIAGAKIRRNKNSPYALVFRRGMPLSQPRYIQIREIPEDAFELLLRCTRKDGVICPPYLAEILQNCYYPQEGTKEERFNGLKTLENAKREELSEQYAIPLWTSPIHNEPELEENMLQDKVKKTVGDSSMLKRLRLFSEKNTRIQFKKNVWHSYVKKGKRETQDEELQFLYKQLVEGDFVFADWYKNLPRTVNGALVLEEVILKNPTDLHLESDMFTFTARISTEARFWDPVRDLFETKTFVEASCSFLSVQGEMIFEINVEVEEMFSVTKEFQLMLHTLSLQSGLDASRYNLPQFFGVCEIGRFQCAFCLEIDSHEMTLNGEFPNGEIGSISDVLGLVGLPKNLDVFPKDLSETVFGAFGLKSLEVQIDTESLNIHRMEMVMSTEKPWKIVGDRVVLQSYFYLILEEPFDSEKREIDLQIEGIWTLGTTKFHTIVQLESGELSAFMEEGETLDEKAVQAFIGDVPLPDFAITNMEFDANYKTGSWAASLEAEKCLAFAVGGTEIEIGNIALSVECNDGKLEDLELAGCFTIGSISMYLQGRYASKEDWEFSASGMENTEVRFSELWKQLAEEVPSFSGLETVVPEDFLSFRIGKLYADYHNLQKSFCLYLTLEEIKITDSFVIDSVFADIHTGMEARGQTEDAVLQELQLKAGFTVAGASLQLEIFKSLDGFGIKGQTAEEQCIAVGKLLKEFVDDVLGYAVELPEAMVSFTIRTISFQYEKGREKTGFDFLCEADFGGEDAVLTFVFRAGARLSVKGKKEEISKTQDSAWSYGFSILCSLEPAKGQLLKVSYDYDAKEKEKQSCISFRYEAESEEDVLTLYEILEEMGVSVAESWSFLTQFGFKKAELSYDFSQKIFSGFLGLGNGGSFSIILKMGDPSGYAVRGVTNISLSLAELPVVGGIAGHALTNPGKLSVSNLNLYALSEPDEKEGLSAGVWFTFAALGKAQKLQIYEPQVNASAKIGIDMQAEGPNTSSKMYWKKLDQTAALFTLHRLGIGMEDNYLVFALDASLSVRPFIFTMLGAGIRVGLSDYRPHFALTGFGVEFQNELMTIGGCLNCTETGYRGTLIVQIKTISVLAQIWYDEDGSLFAYAVVNGNIGGTPAFFITGLALGFAWNKRISIPEIGKVAQSPLILAATGKISQEELQAQLYDALIKEDGARVLTAGIRFTMFEIVDSFLLLFVRFGTQFELDLLGTAELTMPPNCPKNVTPLAYAKLELKASVKPEEGFAGVEARLTDESYILSKDCRLMGGFAFYLWYQGEHSGDFVITFGGYHPKYETTKPKHYPEVPRVGFLWKIGNCITIDGEMYFALTPSAVMAGGRLSAVYEVGPLKAYFIAKVDFYLSWKPFSYDASVGIVLGGSLRIHLLFVSVTLKLELGAELHIWGPDFSARARISLWIISFEISFGANASQEERAIEWEDFCETFLPKNSEAKKTVRRTDERETSDPLKISFCSGLKGKLKIGQEEYSVLRPDGIEIVVESVMPLHSAMVNQDPLPVKGADTCIKPMKEKGAVFVSEISVAVKQDECEGSDDFEGNVIEKNLPSAIWGGEQELLKAPCGIMLRLREKKYSLFPVNRFISLEDLYAKGAIVIKEAFCFLHPACLPDYTSTMTISKFAETVAKKEAEQRRQETLMKFGIVLEKAISLKRYASEAENYLDEEVLIAEE